MRGGQSGCAAHNLSYKVEDLAGDVFEVIGEWVKPSPSVLRYVASVINAAPGENNLRPQTRCGGLARSLVPHDSVQFASEPEI